MILDRDKNTAPVPRHVAIIMDGNGRWAERRGWERFAGHRAGVEAVRRTVEEAVQLSIEQLTLYAFSTENWRRPPSEVGALLRLLSSMIDEEARTCLRDNIRLRLVGTIERLEPRLRDKVVEAVELNRDNTGLTLCLAFDYGSRAEIVKAAREIVATMPQDARVDEGTIQHHLYTAGMPDVDLLIRCGGEMRISNFLMWQSAYAELYFTDVLWPDFGQAEIDVALREFARRDRRFGGQNKDRDA